MPITLTLPVDGGAFGPGLLVNASSTEPIPDPGSRRWAIAIEDEGGFPISQVFVNEHGSTFRQYFMINQGQFGLTLNTGLQQPIQGRAYRVVVEHEDQGIVTSSASRAITWDGQSGLGLQAFQQRAGGAIQGGFTAEDRQLLQTTTDRTSLLGEIGQLVVSTASGLVPTTLAEIFSRNTLDKLTLDELTSGETCDPVRVTVADWYYSIIVRVTTIREDLVPKTPDHEWYFPDLAVLRIFRGADLEYRRGIHTPTFKVEKPMEWGWQILQAARVLGVAADYTIAVDWREGCCGRVFISRFP